MLDTPVLFLVYNRAELTSKVLAVIRQMRPKQLFIAADGPRAEIPGDYEKCQSVRNILSSGIDWVGDLQMLLRDRNLGCKMAVSSAISWFFEHVPEGIILEDDTLPSPSFFNFCQNLLTKYRNNSSVMHVGGGNFQQGRVRGFASYYFSKFNHIWGWATWRRAWNCYDIGMQGFPEFKDCLSTQVDFGSEEERQYWMRVLQMAYDGRIDTWDFQWMFALWKKGGLSALPNVNLVSNIGCGPGATNADHNSWLGKLPFGGLSRIVHPSCIKIDSTADQFTFNHVFANRPIPTLNIIARMEHHFRGKCGGVEGPIRRTKLV